MGIRGKQVGGYENPRKVEQRTWRKIQFVQSKVKPEWWFLYDREDGKERKIGWLHERKLSDLSVLGDMVPFHIKDGQVKEIRQDMLRIATGYHPLLNPDPNGYNKKDGREGIHSRSPLPDKE